MAREGGDDLSEAGPLLGRLGLAQQRGGGQRREDDQGAAGVERKQGVPAAEHPAQGCAHRHAQGDPAPHQPHDAPALVGAARVARQAEQQGERGDVGTALREAQRHEGGEGDVQAQGEEERRIHEQGPRDDRHAPAPAVGPGPGQGRGRQRPDHVDGHEERGGQLGDGEALLHQAAQDGHGKRDRQQGQDGDDTQDRHAAAAVGCGGRHGRHGMFRAPWRPRCWRSPPTGPPRIRWG